LIWLIVVAVVIVPGLAWLVARDWRTRGAIAGVGLAAVALYWVMGRPGEFDQPLDGRLHELEQVARTSPDSITPEQFLAMQQEQARQFPKDPAPYKRIGDLYLANGRADEALIAYQSALRRDPSYEPAADAISELHFIVDGEIDAATREKLAALRVRAQADPQSLTNVQILALIEERVQAAPDDAEALRMMGDIYASVGHTEKAEAAYRSGLDKAPNDRLLIKAWADTRFKATQKIDTQTSDLYNRAYALDPTDLRIGYMAGIGLWLQGKKAEAEALWAKVNARAPEAGPERQMFAALREMFGVDGPSPENPPKK
jgi:cytochrome c-type biogenesis protein CcmH/NrfG